MIHIGQLTGRATLHAGFEETADGLNLTYLRQTSQVLCTAQPKPFALLMLQIRKGGRAPYSRWISLKHEAASELLEGTPDPFHSSWIEPFRVLIDKPDH